MPWWGDDSEQERAYNAVCTVNSLSLFRSPSSLPIFFEQYQSGHHHHRHQASMTHELLAGAAAYEVKFLISLLLHVLWEAGH